MSLSRRSFLAGILAAGIAPAFVRASSLMRVIVPNTEIIVPAAQLWQMQISDASLTVEQIVREALKVLEQQVASGIDADVYATALNSNLLIRPLEFGWKKRYGSDSGR